MTARPRADLRRVLDDLGGTLLELVHGEADPTDSPSSARDIGGLVILDPLDPMVLPPDALVLAVGVEGEEQVLRLLDDLGRQGAVGLVVRAPVPTAPAVLAASRSGGVALLGLVRGAAWAQLTAMLRSLLADGDVGVGVGETESLGGVPAGDLFALANAISALLDAPLTIEDRTNRVLAFSGRQDEADRSRVETVLGLQVPERYSRVLAERGVFRALHHSTAPVAVEPVTLDDGPPTLPRVAVAVRAGQEVLGSIWVVARTPLDAQKIGVLAEAAKLVALHLLRVRAGADVERRLQSDLLSTAVEGGAGARDALTRLGLADQPVVVMALAVLDADPALAGERQRLSDAFAVHLGAVHSRSATALVGRVAYGLLPLPPESEDGEERAARIATDFLDRLGDRARAVIGIGTLARDVAGLARSRACADRAVRVLRDGPGTRRVARLRDVSTASLVLELRDVVAARGDEPTGPVAALTAYDARHGSALVETLRAWLDSFGDVSAASEALFVHPNTFRYRLRRLAQVGDMDLTDPEARFAALLQLRLLPRRRDGS